MANGLIKLALFIQGSSQVVVRFRLVGFDLEGLGIMANGLIKLAFFI